MFQSFFPSLFRDFSHLNLAATWRLWQLGARNEPMVIWIVGLVTQPDIANSDHVGF